MSRLSPLAVIMLCLLAALFSCATPGESGPRILPDPGEGTVLHFLSAPGEKWYLESRVEREWTGEWFETRAEGSRYNAHIPKGRGSEVRFHSETGRVVPGGEGFFRISRPEVWIKSGLVLPYDPDAPAQRSRFVLAVTLNLHTWQEAQPRKKLDLAASALAPLRPDIFLVQESGQDQEGLPAENPPAPFQAGDEPVFEDATETPGNSALMLTRLLSEKTGVPWGFHWSWGHLGFGRYQEGLAVLTPHKIADAGNFWVSDSQERDDIDARKAAWVEVVVPDFGPLRTASIHLSWGAVQRSQLSVLHEKSAALRLDLVAGDFNMPPRHENYAWFLSQEGWEDAYHAANPEGLFDHTRIDYVFQSPHSGLKAVSAQFYFMPGLGGAVSDHPGVLIWFEKRSEP